MNAAPSSLPPPLPPKNASSLAFLLNGVLALFIADAGMSLLDDTLVAFTGLHLVSGIRALVALLTGLLALLTYLLIGLMPRIPKSLFLPVTLFNPVALLVAIPLEIYFFQHLPWIAWGSSLGQVILAFYLISRLQPKMWPRWPLMPSGSLGSRRFSWRHSLTFVGINMLLLVPLVALYLGFCAHIAVDHFSAGFVGLKFDRLTMQAKTYSRADGKSVTLVPMMHIGESSFYEEIAKTFATNSIVLLEGVSDSKSLLRQKLSYKRMAESLGLSEQHQSFEPTQGTLRMADVDVSSFSQSTVKLLNLVTTLHAGKATPQTFLQFMQQCQDLNVARGLWSDILLKRNEHLLQEIKQALTESEIIIVPWGAAHMPGISSGVESFGFHLQDQKEFVVVRFSGVFSKLRASRTENRWCPFSPVPPLSDGYVANTMNSSMSQLPMPSLFASAWFRLMLLSFFSATSLFAQSLELTLQTRDRVTGAIVLSKESVDPKRVGVIAVDVWNYHWCKTATMRVDAIVPRINQALEGARALGMTVMLCPSDVVDNYVGFPQREAALALPLLPVPAVVNVSCPPVPDAGGCACGRERCAGNYGWDGMHPGLRIGELDLMPDTQAEVYAICKKYGLTHLIYVGFHTQVCLLGKPMGLKAMKSAGLRCVLARDMTDAHPGYDPARGFTPDLNTEQVIEHFEKHLAPTLSFEDELAKAGRWDKSVILDPVRVTPWGTSMRPHLFEQPVTVTLTTPLQPHAQIRYTVDGSAPTATSTLYTQPLVIQQTTHLRIGGFEQGRPVCRESEGAFFRMSPVPPAPELAIGDLKPIRNVGFGHTYGGGVRYSGSTKAPQKDRSNLGQEIRIDRKSFSQGMGVHAPCELTYEIKPEYRRFVALAGADENLITINNGSNLAKYPSVVFKVFIDGREMASSPVMRILSPAWRFDVAIPEHAQRISLVTLDAGDGSREDFADWANAGFVLQH